MRKDGRESRAGPRRKKWAGGQKRRMKGGFWREGADKQRVRD